MIPNNTHTVIPKKLGGGNTIKLTDMLTISLARSIESRYNPLLERMKLRGCTYTNTKVDAIEGRDMVHNPTKKLSNNTYACLLSHIKALETAREMKLPCVLIIEDDVDFVQGFTGKLNSIMTELPSDWDAMWLGGRNLFRPDRYSDRLNRLVGSWGGYGYVVSAKAYTRLIDGLKKEKVACDDYYRKIHNVMKCYRPKVDFVLHIGGYSDRQDK